MQAIKVSFRGPTNHSGSRFIVSAGKGRKRMTVSRGSDLAALSIEHGMAECATRYATKMGWTGKLVGGCLDGVGDEYVFVFVS